MPGAEVVAAYQSSILERRTSTLGASAQLKVEMV